jgi:N6-L-threonylcarbamoyladenine synthase
MLRRDQRPGDADYYDLSFSGLKTAVLNAVRGERDLSDGDRAMIALAFQDAIVETLVEKTARAVNHYRRERVVLGGGVAANRALLTAMQQRMDALGARVYAPSSRLATDNAAMIARAGLFHLERGERAGLDLSAFASLPLPGLLA